MSRFFGLYLGISETDFDETWQMCWKSGPIDCIRQGCPWIVCQGNNPVLNTGADV